jgi:iron complex transport system permease protein
MTAGLTPRRTVRLPAALVIALGVVALVASIAAAMTLGAADVSS